MHPIAAIIANILNIIKPVLPLSPASPFIFPHKLRCQAFFDPYDICAGIQQQFGGFYMAKGRFREIAGLIYKAKEKLSSTNPRIDRRTSMCALGTTPLADPGTAGRVVSQQQTQQQ